MSTRIRVRVSVGPSLWLALAAPVPAIAAVAGAMAASDLPGDYGFLAAAVAGIALCGGAFFGSRLVVGSAVTWAAMSAAFALTRSGVPVGSAVPIGLGIWLAAELAISSFSTRGLARLGAEARRVMAANWIAIAAVSAGIGACLTWLGTPVSTRTVELDTLAVIGAVAIVGATAGLVHRRLTGP